MDVTATYANNLFGLSRYGFRKISDSELFCYRCSQGLVFDIVDQDIITVWILSDFVNVGMFATILSFLLTLGVEISKRIDEIRGEASRNFIVSGGSSVRVSDVVVTA